MNQEKGNKKKTKGKEGEKKGSDYIHICVHSRLAMYTQVGITNLLVNIKSYYNLICID